MKTKKNKIEGTARKYNSLIIKKLMEGVSSLEKRKVEDRMVLAARIADLLRTKGDEWNQSKLAEVTGKSPSVITKWLSGTHNFTFDTLTEICHALGIKMSDLFRDYKYFPQSKPNYSS